MLEDGLFHTIGVAHEKADEPNLVVSRGTLSIFVVDERKFLAVDTLRRHRIGMREHPFPWS